QGAVAGGEDLLRVEPGARSRFAEALPERPHRGGAHESLAVRRRLGVLEDAVGRHERHHAVHVVAVECFVEPVDGVERGLRLGVGHAGPSRSSILPDRRTVAPWDTIAARWPRERRPRRMLRRTRPRSTARRWRRCRSATPWNSTSPGVVWW